MFTGYLELELILQISTYKFSRQRERGKNVILKDILYLPHSLHYNCGLFHNKNSVQFNLH